MDNTLQTYTISVTLHIEYCSKVFTNCNSFNPHNFIKQVMMVKLGTTEAKQISQGCIGNKWWHQAPHLGSLTPNLWTSIGKHWTNILFLSFLQRLGLWPIFLYSDHHVCLPLLVWMVFALRDLFPNHFCFAILIYCIPESLIITATLLFCTSPCLHINIWSKLRASEMK